jgi:hypothetical protein
MTRNNKWRFFVGAAILAAGLLLKSGAPPLAVVLGIGAAALPTLREKRPA